MHIEAAWQRAASNRTVLQICNLVFRHVAQKSRKLRGRDGQGGGKRGYGGRRRQGCGCAGRWRCFKAAPGESDAQPDQGESHIAVQHRISPAHRWQLTIRSAPDLFRLVNQIDEAIGFELREQVRWRTERDYSEHALDMFLALA